MKSDRARPSPTRSWRALMGLSVALVLLTDLGTLEAQHIDIWLQNGTGPLKGR